MTGRNIKTSLVCIFLVCLSTPLASQETTSFMISWAPNPEPNITEYVVYRSSVPDAGFTALDSVDASTHSYTDTGLPKGDRRYYRIVAKNADGLRSSFSNPVSGLTIPQDADASTKNQCRIVEVVKTGEGSYDVSWTTLASSIGFIQYDLDTALDSASVWDTGFGTEHTTAIGGLEEPATYYMRSIAYDNSNNMTISVTDTMELTDEQPVAPTAPALEIYPVPYHPNKGTMTLENLPEGGSVQIFNERGLEVWKRSVGTDAQLSWDGTNSRGSNVMSGVYYVAIKNSKGDVVNKRPIMIVQ